MTEAQADRIIELLADIRDALREDVDASSSINVYVPEPEESTTVTYGPQAHQHKNPE